MYRRNETWRSLCRWMAGFAWGLLAVSLSTPARAEAATVKIGQMTLAYDPADWRINLGDGTTLLSCLIETCEGAMFEVRISPMRAARCYNHEVYREAATLFQRGKRTAVNMYKLGPLALVMAEASIGDEYGSPAAVYGCISHGFLNYRFTSVARYGVYPINTGGTLIALLKGLTAGPLPRDEITVGDLRFSFSTDQLLDNAKEKVPGLRVLACLPPSCDDWNGTVVVRVTDGEAACFGDEQNRREFYSLNESPTTVVAGSGPSAITFSVANFWSGCRNATPPHQVACAVRNGKTYIVDAGGGLGCTSTGEVPATLFLDLVRSARPAT